MSGWTALRWAKNQKTGSSARKLVLLLLSERCDDSFSCFPSNRLVGDEAEIDGKQVARHLKALRELGLIRSEIRSRSSDGGQTSNRHYVLTPERIVMDHARPDGERLCAEHHRCPVRFAPGPLEGPPLPPGGDPGGPTEGVGPLPSEGPQEHPEEPPEEVPMEPPSTPARGRQPAHDGRRPPTGSTAREPSGSAASETSKPATTNQQRQAAQHVLQQLPAGLATLLPAKTPPALTRAILDALAQDDPAADRTPDQLVRHRVMPKWDKHWAGLADSGQLARPVGALITMLNRTTECGNPRCDERVDVDTGQQCPFCRARTELHAALRRAPAGPPEEPAPEPPPAEPAHEPPAGDLPPPPAIPTQRTTEPAEPHPVAAAIRQQIRAARPHVHHQHNRTRKTA